MSREAEERAASSTEHSLIDQWADSVLREFRAKPARSFGEYIATPFGILIPLVDLYTVEEKIRFGNSWRRCIQFVGLALFIVTVAGSLGAIFSILGLPDVFPDLSKQFPRVFSVWAAIWAVFQSLFFKLGWFFNVGFLVLLVLLGYLSEARRTLNFKLDGILGHKVWAKKNTHELLSSLISSDLGIKKAKWFIVNFLSHLADERIRRIILRSSSGEYTRENGLKKTMSSPASAWRVTTESDGTWHVCRYSAFLATNMENAEDSIVWLVDPGDFFGFLLPELVDHTLVCLAATRFGFPPVDEEAFINVYKDIAKSAKIVFKQDVCAALEREAGPDRDRLMRGYQGFVNDKDYEGIWQSFQNTILAPMRWLGYSLLTTTGISLDEIKTQFRTFHKQFLASAFPHLEAFRNASVSKKRRVIFIPEKVDANLEDRITQLLELHMGNWPREMQGFLKNDPAHGVEIIAIALTLFEWLCGEDHKQEILEVRRPTFDCHIKFASPCLDVGIYDDRIIVWSRRAKAKVAGVTEPTSHGQSQGCTCQGEEGNGIGVKEGLFNRRVVDWFYLPRLADECFDSAEAEKQLNGLEEVNRCEDALFAGMTILKSGLSKPVKYEDFRRYILNSSKKLLNSPSNGSP